MLRAQREVEIAALGAAAADPAVATALARGLGSRR
jgi:stage V sporulation protein SpoVS